MDPRPLPKEAEAVPRLHRIDLAIVPAGQAGELLFLAEFQERIHPLNTGHRRLVEDHQIPAAHSSPRRPQTHLEPAVRRASGTRGLTGLQMGVAHVLAPATTMPARFGEKALKLRTQTPNIGVT